MKAIQGEVQIKQAYIDGYLTDAEFEAQIDKVVRGEQSLFFLGDRQPDPLFGPDLITDPRLPTKHTPASVRVVGSGANRHTLVGRERTEPVAQRQVGLPSPDDLLDPPLPRRRRARRVGAELMHLRDERNPCPK